MGRVQRLTSTVVAIVGPRAEDAAATLAAQANVRVLRATGAPLSTWAEVTRTRSPYCVLTDDPLVAAAWTALFADRSATGALEVAVATLQQRIRAGAVDLPDHYLVLSDASSEVSSPSFHLTVLHPRASARVTPVDATDRLPRVVSHLRAGRWWPAPSTLLADLERQLPDVFATAGSDDADGPSLVTG